MGKVSRKEERTDIEVRLRGYYIWIGRLQGIGENGNELIMFIEL